MAWPPSDESVISSVISISSSVRVSIADVVSVFSVLQADRETSMAAIVTSAEIPNSFLCFILLTSHLWYEPNIKPLP